MSVLRGLRHRAGMNALMLVVAVIAAAVAAAAPAYYSASQRSILVDTALAGAPIGRGVEIVESGSMAGSIDPLAGQVGSELSADTGPAAARRDFAPPIEALEASAQYTPEHEDLPLVWRSGFCRRLSIQGACPDQAGQVAISTSLASANRWKVGDQVRVPLWGPLTVTGIYAPPAHPGDYWFDRVSQYFGAENPSGGARGTPAFDALFTPRSTIEEGPTSAQGDTVVDTLLAPSRIPAADVSVLSAGVSALSADPVFNAENATVTSSIPATLQQVRTGWSALAVPVVVTTAQVLALGWLLLFLVVADAAEARGPEVALARLRGQGRWRIIRFALAEPAMILLIALPLGALAGWGGAGVLGARLLRPGTPVGLPGLGWAAAAAALAGGLIAVILASRSMLQRPVVEQWRRTGRRATERGWVLDAVLLVATAGGLTELFASGQVGPAGHRVLSLLVPGLLGLAVAVVASRLLPLACRAATRARRGGGLASFLALRQAARRPGGTRTTMLLITAVALATFASSAWLVGRGNYSLVARATVGAPTVLSVTVPQGISLASVVDRADPSGRRAAAVEEYGSGNEITLAVQPDRFASVASWAAPGSRRAALAAGLQPAEAPPLRLSGDAVRIALTTRGVGPRSGELIVDVVTPSSLGPDPVDLGPVPASGPVVLSAPLPGCPCVVSDIQLNLTSPGLGPATAEVGDLSLTAFDQRTGGGWQPVPGALSAASRWRPEPAGNPATGQIGPGGTGLAWTFSTPPGQSPTLQSADRPERLPALVSKSLGVRPGTRATAVGLDGTALPVQVLATLPVVPGAPGGGVVVDQDFANLVAAGDTLDAQQQVWVAAGAGPAVAARLRAAGVGISATSTEASAEAVLSRQGPALANILYLADAAAAAALGAVGALAGLYAFARRRTYEYAALVAVGLPRRAVNRSLLLEQGLVLGFAAVVGIGAGLIAVAVALRDVPEFMNQPAAPHLSYTPGLPGLATILAGLIAVLAAAAVASSVSLARRARAEQLREGPA